MQFLRFNLIILITRRFINLILMQLFILRIKIILLVNHIINNIDLLQ